MAIYNPLNQKAALPKKVGTRRRLGDPEPRDPALRGKPTQAGMRAGSGVSATNAMPFPTRPPTPNDRPVTPVPNPTLGGAPRPTTGGGQAPPQTLPMQTPLGAPPTNFIPPPTQTEPLPRGGQQVAGINLGTGQQTQTTLPRLMPGGVPTVGGSQGTGVQSPVQIGNTPPPNVRYPEPTLPPNGGTGGTPRPTPQPGPTPVGGNTPPSPVYNPPSGRRVVPAPFKFTPSGDTADIYAQLPKNYQQDIAGWDPQLGNAYLRAYAAGDFDAANEIRDAAYKSRDALNDVRQGIKQKNQGMGTRAGGGGVTPVGGGAGQGGGKKGKGGGTGAGAGQGGGNLIVPPLDDQQGTEAPPLNEPTQSLSAQVQALNQRIAALQAKIQGGGTPDQIAKWNKALATAQQQLKAAQKKQKKSGAPAGSKKNPYVNHAATYNPLGYGARLRV